MMLFTSGTTGKSKAVEITASNLRYSIKNFEEPFTLDGMDRILTPIPYYHIFGFLHVAETLNYGKTVCIGRGIRYLFLDMAVLNPDMLNTVPAILESLTKSLKRNTSEQAVQRYVGRNLKLITYGGALLKPNICHFLIDLGLKMYVCYGMTEISCGATWADVDKEHAGTAGKFCEYIQHRFEDGELLVTGPTLMKGYYKDPEETAKVLENGWLHTGDLGHCDEDGYFYLTGRKKNVIILSNGENVNPEEIEIKLGACEAVIECLVDGDEKGICADIYTDDPDRVQQFIKEYNKKVPMYYQIYKVNCQSVPLEKTGIGKIKRKERKYV
jgi:long-chain acyl-CoA synthetase